MEAGILALVGHGGAVKRCLAGTSLIFLRMLTEATACNFRRSAFNGPVYLRHDVMPDLTATYKQQPKGLPNYLDV